MTPNERKRIEDRLKYDLLHEPPRVIEIPVVRYVPEDTGKRHKSKKVTAAQLPQVVGVPKYYEEQLTVFDPPTFYDYIGQEEAKDICRIMIDSAKIDKRSLPNIMIDGDAGLGKTTLSKLIVKEFGKPFVLTDGTSANKLTDFSGFMIIDEIHNLDAVVCDTLNILLDQGVVHIIGCTTKMGSMPKPFRSRFRKLHLDRYSVEDITEILVRAINRKGYKIDDNEAIEELARRSRNTPRTGLSYLSLIFEMVTVRHEKTISGQVVYDAFEKLTVDDIGLTKLDYQYLAAIPTDRAVGLQYISARISVDEDTIEEEIEPYLMQLGLIDRTRQGRKKITVEVIDELEHQLKSSLSELFGGGDNDSTPG